MKWPGAIADKGRVEIAGSGDEQDNIIRAVPTRRRNFHIGGERTTDADRSRLARRRSPGEASGGFM